MASLLINRCTKATLVAKLKAKVRTPLLLKLLLSTLGSDSFHHGDGILRLKDFRLQLTKPATKAKHRRATHVDM